MLFSARWLAQVRQYAKLEAQLNRDFSAPIQQLSEIEADRLEAEGWSEEEVYDGINAALAREVQRFPVSIQPIPF